MGRNLRPCIAPGEVREYEDREYPDKKRMRSRFGWQTSVSRRNNTDLEETKRDQNDGTQEKAGERELMMG